MQNLDISKQKFYISTAIAYPNGEPHIGHAYEYVATDMISRFKRLDGFEVFYLTGTDEHGQKMSQKAEELGVTPQALVDKNAAVFKNLHQTLLSKYDRFIRTTDKDHIETCQTIWKKMQENGDIYLDKYTGWYSIVDEAYFTEDEVEDSDGGKIAVSTGNKVQWQEEESYFFRLSKYKDFLVDLFNKDENFLAPISRKNEILGFLKQDIKDLSISRSSFDWGIPVPGDDKHVMYVWTDALFNYLSGIGFVSDSKSFEYFWPADVQIIGKDITKFHAVYFPAFLKSAGIELPKRIFSHGFLFNKGEKMSKSLGNIISPFDLVNEFGVDIIRYFFLREIPFGQDGNYSKESILNRANTDLSNELGNLFQRTLTLVVKYCDSKVPYNPKVTDDDLILLNESSAMLEKIRILVEKQDLTRSLEVVWKCLNNTNRYFSKEEPWALAKSDLDRMQSVLFTTLQVLKQVCLLLQPIIPIAAGNFLTQLKVAEDVRSFKYFDTPLASGIDLSKPVIVFPRH